MLWLLIPMSFALAYGRGFFNEISLAAYIFSLGIAWVFYARDQFQISQVSIRWVLGVLPLLFFIRDPLIYARADLNSFKTPLLIAVLSISISQLFRGKSFSIPLQLFGTLGIALMVYLVPWFSPRPWIDVYVVQNESAEALLDGQNPYAIEYTDIYSRGKNPRRRSALYYPYPPLTLLFNVAGYLAGDTRFAFITLHLLSGVLLYLIARNLSITRPLDWFSLWMLLPVGPFFAEQAWNDSLVVFLFALVAFLQSRRRDDLAQWGIGFLFAAKQSALGFAPLLLFPTLSKWLKAGSWDPKAILRLALPFYVTFGAFAAIDFPNLIRGTITYHVGTPFRPDGLTIGALFLRLGGSVPTGVWNPIVLLSTSVICIYSIYRRGFRPDRWFIAMGLVYWSTLLVSKHAFCNYYYTVHFLLILGCLWGASNSSRRWTIPVTHSEAAVSPMQSRIKAG